MNAIIALCHFCEAHGACILFCTQAFHQSQDAQLLLDSAPVNRRGPVQSRPEPESSLSPVMHPPPKSADQCEACWSIPADQTGFISYDSRAQITYISGQYPEQPQLYSILRQACIRSLNCEVCPGREGPIVFGEDESCHVFSHTFNLRDSQARGFTRLYSFIVVMMDRVFLINSWLFLVRHFRSLIDHLQGKAEKVYTQESDFKTTLRSPSAPDYFRRIRSNRMGRSLKDLTGDKDVFLYLHKYFVFLLKTGGKRMTECMVEGPPQAMEVCEAGEVMEDEELMHHLNKPLSAVDFRVLPIEGQPTFRSLQHLAKIFKKEDFRELAYHIVRGNQLMVRGSDASTVMSVLNVFKELLPESCCRIVGFSHDYHESYVCNFLGLSLGVNLPEHIVNSEYNILVDVLPPRERYYTQMPSLDPSVLEGMDPLEQYKFIVYSASPKLDSQKCPNFVHRLMSIVYSDVFSDTLVSRAIQGLKEEWMNKVKIFYKFSQMYPKESKDPKDLKESIQKDERYVKLLKDVLFVSFDDLPVLLHWRSALSKDYRAYLMQRDSS